MNSDRVDGIHPIFNMSRYTNRDHNQLFAFETRCVFFLHSFELAFGGGVKRLINNNNGFAMLRLWPDLKQM